SEGVRGVRGGLFGLGLEGVVEDGPAHLDANASVVVTKGVGREVKLVIVELCEKAVLTGQEDLRPVEPLGVAPGEALLGLGGGKCCLDRRTLGQSCGHFIGGRAAEVGHAVRNGGEVCGWKADEVRKMELVRRGLVLRVEVRKTNLCSGEPGLREIHLAVDASVEAVGDDGDKLLGACKLFVERLLACQVAVKCEVGDDGVLFNGGPGVVKTEYSGLQAEARGANVITLRPAEDGAGYLGVDDRWLAQGVTIRV